MRDTTSRVILYSSRSAHVERDASRGKRKTPEILYYSPSLSLPLPPPSLSLSVYLSPHLLHSSIALFSGAFRLARYTLSGTWILLSRDRCRPAEPLASPHIVRIELLLALSRAQIPDAGRREPGAGDAGESDLKCIGSCVHVLFPFNRVSTFKISSPENRRVLRAPNAPGFWSRGDRPWIRLTTVSSARLPIGGLRADV